MRTISCVGNEELDNEELPLSNAQQCQRYRDLYKIREQISETGSPTRELRKKNAVRQQNYRTRKVDILTTVSVFGTRYIP